MRYIQVSSVKKAIGFLLTLGSTNHIEEKSLQSIIGLISYKQATSTSSHPAFWRVQVI
jgi:hypothetical protein